MNIVRRLPRIPVGHASPQSIHVIIRFGHTPFHTIFVESRAGEIESRGLLRMRGMFNVERPTFNV
jgi:hypothetical protein